jgi:hypothetical protein
LDKMSPEIFEDTYKYGLNVKMACHTSLTLSAEQPEGTDMVTPTSPMVFTILLEA